MVDRLWEKSNLLHASCKVTSQLWIVHGNHRKIFPSDLYIPIFLCFDSWSIATPLYRHMETINPPATISAPPTRTAGVGAVRKKM